MTDHKVDVLRRILLRELDERWFGLSEQVAGVF